LPGVTDFFSFEEAPNNQKTLTNRGDKAFIKTIKEGGFTITIAL
jgi:hypothetical protein